MAIRARSFEDDEQAGAWAVDIALAIDWLNEEYILRRTTRDEQRAKKGDLVATHRVTGETKYIEMKMDTWAKRKDAWFGEWVSQSVSNAVPFGAPGWAITSSADVLGFFSPGERLIFWYDMPRFKEIVASWNGEMKYTCTHADGREWFTWGKIVPRRVVEPALLGKTDVRDLMGVRNHERQFRNWHKKPDLIGVQA